MTKLSLSTARAKELTCSPQVSTLPLKESTLSLRLSILDPCMQIASQAMKTSLLPGGRGWTPLGSRKITQESTQDEVADEETKGKSKKKSKNETE